MTQAVVMGVGLHQFGRFPDKPVEEMARVAIEAALEDSGVPFKDVQLAMMGCAKPEGGWARRVIQQFGWTGIPMTTMSQACASGSAAFRMACLLVEAQVYDVVLVAGYEKMEKGLLTGATAGEAARLVLYTMGLDPVPSRVALEMRKRMEKYEEPLEWYAQVAVQSSELAALNPHAHYQQAHTVDEVLSSTMIADPLTLYMCCPTSDGASAAVVCSKKRAQQYGASRSVQVIGTAAGSPGWEDLNVGPGGEIGGDFKGGRLTKRLATEIYEASGIGPEDVDIAQVHDPFSMAAMVDIEALGFCEEGEGGRMYMEKRTHITGDKPINTDGGILCKGHPLGATGIGQIAEIVKQMREEAGPRQISSPPKIGITHNSGSGLINMHAFQR